MKVHLLGTAAGGGFPQWNCNCRQCHGVRTGTVRALPRTQSSVAVSSDGIRWFLLNASPDIRVQIQAMGGLLPPAGRSRGTGVEGILLSNADLDHTLGLLSLREGGRLRVHATPAVRQSLVEGLRLDQILGMYGGIDFEDSALEPSPLYTSRKEASGLSYRAIPVPGKLPRYREGNVDPSPGDNVAYFLRDLRTGGRLLYLPALAVLTPEILGLFEECDLLLLDGTFWDEDELRRLDVSSLSASQMGHLPIGGSGGSLDRISRLRTKKKVYVHINNTNPILIEDSPEHRRTVGSGVVIGQDGMELEL